MDRVRLDVQETSRNSEKLRPKASRPPLPRVRSACRTGESSVSRNSLSDVLRLSPADRTGCLWVPAAEGTSARLPEPPGRGGLGARAVCSGTGSPQDLPFLPNI